MKGMRSAEGPPNSQSPSSPTPMMQFMKPITGLVVAQVFAKYHGLAPGGTIVKDNLAPMYTLVSSTILYWLIDGAVVQLPVLFFTSGDRLDQILRRCAYACAVLAALSLLSMFFLEYPFSIVPLIIWAFLSPVLVAWPVRGELYNLLRGGVITKICDTVANWWRGVNVINEEAFSSAV